MKSKSTNPNGANQYLLDPRQKKCWDFYVDPDSETFANATKSAIRAGYTEEYADDITSTEWFWVKLWRLNATETGEKKLRELLDLDLRNGGEKVDVGIARIQADLAKYITQTLGKDKGYSTKTEVDHTTKGEKMRTSHPAEAQELAKQFEEKLKKIYEEDQSSE